MAGLMSLVAGSPMIALVPEASNEGAAIILDRFMLHIPKKGKVSVNFTQKEELQGASFPSY